MVMVPRDRMIECFRETIRSAVLIVREDLPREIDAWVRNAAEDLEDWVRQASQTSATGVELPESEPESVEPGSVDPATLKAPTDDDYARWQRAIDNEPTVEAEWESIDVPTISVTTSPEFDGLIERIHDALLDR